MNPPTKTGFRDPNELTIHRALKSMPRLANDDPKMIAWRKGMKRSGPDAREILITAEGEIVDGRHWFWNAKQLQWDRVRVRVVPDDEVMAFIFDTLANRRHYTKGQLAYLLAPMLEEAIKEARSREISSLKRGAESPAPHSVRSGTQTPEEIASDIGVSYRVLLQAIELHELFANHTEKRTLNDRNGETEKGVTFKEFFEPRILMTEDPEDKNTRPYGLGGALAGIKQILSMEEHSAKGRPHHGGVPEKIEKQMSLFRDALHDLQVRYEYWSKWPEEVRQQAVEKLPIVIEKMPDDLLVKFEAAIRTERKRRNKE